jgi:septal ring factor EnvC (AmiA/AmiB activator)
MRSAISRRSAGFLAAALVLASLLASLGIRAQSSPRSREAELANLRTEIARLEVRLDDVRKQQTGLEGDLATADLQLELEEKRLAEAMTARNVAADHESESVARVQALEKDLEASRLAFRHRLSGLYRLGRQGYLRIFFLLRPDERLLPSIRLMRYLVRRDRDSVDRYQQVRQGLARERDRLTVEREEQDQWLVRERAHRRDLVAARQRKAAVLAQVQGEQRDLSLRADVLAQKEKRLSDFVDSIVGANGASLNGTPLSQFRGVLDWPVAGKVTEKFGPRFDPRYHTQTPHNGIDLSTTVGSEVKAIFPGKVLFAAPFEGYGPTVIVLHPGRAFTLYAGLSELKAAQNDMVSFGQIVGLAADHLYFEIRVENHPDDPLTWLR